MSNPTSDSSFEQPEEWRDIPGWEGLYQVSSLGRVWSARFNRFRKTRPTRKGYLTVNLMHKKMRRHYEIQVLVALAFIGPRPSNEYHVDHIDRNKKNNTLSNLRYLHHIENEGQSPRERIGERNPRSKLTDNQRVEIIRDWNAGKYSSKTEVALLYGVNRTTIYRIIGK